MSGNRTFTARLTPETYTIRLHPDGGTLETSELTVSYGSYVPALPEPKRDGYIFEYWFIDGDETAFFAEGQRYMNAGDTDLTALYTPRRYEITFDTRGGDEISGVKYYVDAAVELPVPVRDGYTFAGWYTDEALTEAADITVMPAGNVRLYAAWRTVSGGCGAGEDVSSVLLAALLPAAAALFMRR